MLLSNLLLKGVLEMSSNISEERESAAVLAHIHYSGGQSCVYSNSIKFLSLFWF